MTLNGHGFSFLCFSLIYSFITRYLSFILISSEYILMNELFCQSISISILPQPPFVPSDRIYLNDKAGITKQWQPCLYAWYWPLKHLNGVVFIVDSPPQSLSLTNSLTGTLSVVLPQCSFSCSISHFLSFIFTCILGIIFLKLLRSLTGW